MKSKQLLFLNIAVGVLVASCVLFFSQKGLFERLELGISDFLFRLRGPLSFNKHIIIIEITDEDIAKIGRWPWKRSWHAAMIKALSGLGAKQVYFDILFSEGSQESDDSALEEAIKQNKSVYLPYAFQDNAASSALTPIPRLSSHLKGTGAMNIYPDVDGTVRKAALIFPRETNDYYHAVLAIAMGYSGSSIKERAPNYLLLTNPSLRIKIPLVNENSMEINWPGKWEKTFKHYGYLEILAAYKDYLDNKPVKINLKDFKESICLVGVTALGLYDIKPVPVQAQYPGIGIIASSLNTILNNNFIYHLPAWLNIFILYLLSLIPSFVIFGQRPLRETFFIGIAAFLFSFIVFLLFKLNMKADFATPLLGLISGYFTVGTYNFVRVSKERQAFFRMSVVDGLTGLYNIRYFKMLLETELMMAKLDPSKNFCIIMSDVDHFKHFNDTYGHQVGDLVLKEVAAALKASLRSSDIVARYGGEEMIVLLRGSPFKDGLMVAEKLRKNIENASIKDQNNSYKVTVSLGVSIFHPGDDVDMIIKRADEGLYKAKEAGRNRVFSVEG
ncbi:MAG: diguanylate cyclase [Candidatus Omnitrophota bacterium]